ncbi:uncharacterized protein LOC125768910 [Anopheles funestus]|uniref:uncharacterized protein LOC125768910 n=1 Tax=Anopheles funestus TaxID=62324 RepID=UPI0020C5BDCE|nr:uncharacterized protein LOC125768910 [Anopheles funestus]
MLILPYFSFPYETLSTGKFTKRIGKDNPRASDFHFICRSYRSISTPICKVNRNPTKGTHAFKPYSFQTIFKRSYSTQMPTVDRQPSLNLHSPNQQAKELPKMMKITIAALALLAVAVAAYEHEDYHSHPSYKFEYGVKDPHTGDHKSQWEHRDGDVVKGAYTLHEADGTERVVEYSSDKHNGFQAHVKRVGHAHHPEVYGHHEGGHSYGGHGHGHASSYANGNLYQHHH